MGLDFLLQDQMYILGLNRRQRQGQYVSLYREGVTQAGKRTRRRTRTITKKCRCVKKTSFAVFGLLSRERRNTRRNKNQQPDSNKKHPKKQEPTTRLEQPTPPILQNASFPPPPLPTPNDHLFKLDPRRPRMKMFLFDCVIVIPAAVRLTSLSSWRDARAGQ